MRVHLAGSITQVSKHDMKVHVAGKASATRPLSLPAQAVLAEKHDAHLVTFAYPDDIEWWAAVWPQLASTVIVDSGAFTAWTKGRVFTVEQYAEFTRQFARDHARHLAGMSFMSLDVIGDQSATWRNFEELVKRGVTPMPILTLGAGAVDIDRAAEHEYIALGGMVGSSRQKVQPWLDRVFARLMQRRAAGKPLPRAHLLGMTQPWALNRYPAFSADSSSWLGVVRFGNTRLPGMKQTPSYTKSPAATAAVVKSLRAEVRAYRRMADNATKLWERRGITWH